MRLTATDWQRWPNPSSLYWPTLGVTFKFARLSKTVTYRIVSFNWNDAPTPTRCPKKVTNRWRKNHNQIWVLLGQFFPWTWLGSAWSCLVLVGNDQKTCSRSWMRLRATCDWTGVPWLQQHSVSNFFGTPCLILPFGTNSDLALSEGSFQQPTSRASGLGILTMTDQLQDNDDCPVEFI